MKIRPEWHVVLGRVDLQLLVLRCWILTCAGIQCFRLGLSFRGRICMLQTQTPSP